MLHKAPAEELLLYEIDLAMQTELYEGYHFNPTASVEEYLSREVPFLIVRRSTSTSTSTSGGGGGSGLLGARGARLLAPPKSSVVVLSLDGGSSARIPVSLATDLSDKRRAAAAAIFKSHRDSVASETNFLKSVSAFTIGKLHAEVYEKAAEKSEEAFYRKIFGLPAKAKVSWMVTLRSDYYTVLEALGKEGIAPPKTGAEYANAVTDLRAKGFAATHNGARKRKAREAAEAKAASTSLADMKVLVEQHDSNPKMHKLKHHFSVPGRCGTLWMVDIRRRGRRSQRMMRSRRLPTSAEPSRRSASGSSWRRTK